MGTASGYEQTRRGPCVVVGFRPINECNRDLSTVIVVVDVGATILMRKVAMRCPECGTVVSANDVHFPFFTCAKCRCELCVPARFTVKSHLLGLCAAAFLCYSLGLRGIALVLCVPAASVALGAMLTVIGMRVMPPDLETHWRPGHLQL